MSIILLISGISILLILMWDIFQTIIHINGGGPLSKGLSWGIWNLLFKICGGNPKSIALDYAGPIILISIIFTWVFGMWLGFSLVFLSDDKSVVDTATGFPANIIGNIYFVGYTITSLGNGDLKSGNDLWRIITNLMGISSMFMITLAITYLIPVLQAVIDKRTLSAHINNLGKTPQEIIQNAWNGKDLSALHSRLQELEQLILKHSERHLAYPVLHFFHSTREKYAPPLNFAILMEVVIIQQVYKIDSANNSYIWDSIYKVMGVYLSILERSFVKKAEELPPFHYKDYLLQSNINIQIAGYEERLKKYEGDRKKLKTLITKDGWEWKNVCSD